MENIMKWFCTVFNSFIHWVAFGIIASFIPFLVFVELTKEKFLPGACRILTEATLEGDVALLMIPLVGGLIGETVIRTFYTKGLEIFAAITGILFFALIVSYAKEFRSMDINSLSEESKNHIYDSTKMLFIFMISYALSIMALSSSNQNN
jgi:hypothetical protein